MLKYCCRKHRVQSFFQFESGAYSVSCFCWKPKQILTSKVGTRAEIKLNESGFRPHLCTCKLNWTGKTSWGWWDEWDNTALQTQDSKFKPWRSEAEHASSWSRRLPTIVSFMSGWGRNIFVSFKLPRTGNEPRTLAWKAAVLTTTLGPPPSPRWNGYRMKPLDKAHVVDDSHQVM